MHPDANAGAGTYRLGRAVVAADLQLRAAFAVRRVALYV